MRDFYLYQSVMMFSGYFICVQKINFRLQRWQGFEAAVGAIGIQIPNRQDEAVLDNRHFCSSNLCLPKFILKEDPYRMYIYIYLSLELLHSFRQKGRGLGFFHPQQPVRTTQTLLAVYAGGFGGPEQDWQIADCQPVSHVLLLIKWWVLGVYPCYNQRQNAWKNQD